MQDAAGSDVRDRPDQEAFFRSLLRKMYALLARRGVTGSAADDLVSVSVGEIIHEHGPWPADLAACESAALRRLRDRRVDDIRLRARRASQEAALRCAPVPIEVDASCLIAREESRVAVRQLFDLVPGDLRRLAAAWKTRASDVELAGLVGCDVGELEVRKKRLVRTLRQIVRDEGVDIAALLSALGD